MQVLSRVVARPHSSAQQEVDSLMSELYPAGAPGAALGAGSSAGSAYDVIIAVKKRNILATG